MTKAKTIQDKLARSLDAANTRETKARPKVAAIPRPSAALPAGRRCGKISVSLFEADFQRIEAIRAYMAQRGAIISTSEAIKAALRTVALTDDLRRALDAARREDGRK